MHDSTRLSVVTVYVLKGSTGRRYVGITNDLSRRLREQRAKKTKGGQLLEKFRILKRSYLAIPLGQVAELMKAVGFQDVRRVDDRFFQPVLVGTRPVV
jgi:hypothetical protein